MCIAVVKPCPCPRLSLMQSVMRRWHLVINFRTAMETWFPSSHFNEASQSHNSEFAAVMDCGGETNGFFCREKSTKIPARITRYSSFFCCNWKLPSVTSKRVFSWMRKEHETLRMFFRTRICNPKWVTPLNLTGNWRFVAFFLPLEKKFGDRYPIAYGIRSVQGCRKLSSEAEKKDFHRFFWHACTRSCNDRFQDVWSKIWEELGEKNNCLSSIPIQSASGYREARINC